MRIVGSSHRGRRALGTIVGVLALAAVVTPSAQASGPAFKPAMLNVTGWTRLSGTSLAGTTLAAPALPGPDVSAGIGPGSYLLIDQTDDNSYICTANFVWDGNGGPYLGAAGHCFLPAGVDARSAANPGPFVTRVQVCVSGCAFGGQLGALITGTLKDLGAVAYARQSEGGQDIGNDFGLVHIPSALVPQIRPGMPVWGGPTGTPANLQLGQPVCLYGNAGGLGEVFATKARAGVGGTANATYWYASIPSAPGDSGSAVVNCPGLAGTTAAGILTHLGTNGRGFIAGTTIARAKGMASAAGLTIDVRNA